MLHVLISCHPHFRGWKLSVILLACITKILVLSSTLDKGWHPFGVILSNLLQSYKCAFSLRSLGLRRMISAAVRPAVICVYMPPYPVG